MKWNEMRSLYLDKLGKIEALLERVQNLCHKVPTEIPEETKLAIRQLVPLVQQQKDKLVANRFEVAVLGTEKAGKSSLLNAWLGQDILPNKDERCTYTSCEIWSASENEQKYAIEYYTAAEFEQQVVEKQEEAQRFPAGGSDRAKIEDDLKEIDSLRQQIHHFLSKGYDEKRFNEVSEVREDLKQAIAENKAQARAVKRLQLWTINLKQARDIVFHDVPGFDSPLQIHKRQAEEKVRQCDVIIYAKPHDKPDLTDSEVRMLQMADEADKHVTVAQKIFIALTKIDTSKNSEQLENRIAIARGKWGNIPTKRIVPVCPPARLYRLGTGNPEMMTIGSRIERDLEELNATDGIDQLKAVVNHYIDTDRAQILATRCNGLVNDVVEIATDVVQLLQTHYPDCPEELSTALEDETFNKLTDWWVAEWQKIEEDFTDYYTSQIMPKEAVDVPAQENEKLRRFQTLFSNRMDELKEGLVLSEETLEKRYKALGLTEEGIIQPTKAHLKLREEIHAKAMVELHTISADLANTLEEIIHEIVDWIVNRLWKSEKVREVLLESSNQLHNRIEHGMSTLFLRFARPVVTLFLNFPRGERQQLIETYSSEIVVLSEFYLGKDKYQKGQLSHFLETGTWDKHSQPDDKTEDDYFEDVDLAMNDFQSATNLTDIKAEICEDLEALNDYLKNSVFFAAGFFSYCRQELDRVKDTFLDNEKEWRKAIAYNFRRKHPPLMKVIPFSAAQDFEFRRSIVVELAEVQNMLQTL